MIRAPVLGLLFLAGCGAAALEPVWMGRSPDGAARVRVLPAERGERLVLDDREVGVFAAVAVQHLRWSDGAVVVPVQTELGWHVLVGTTLGPAHDAVAEVRVVEGGVAYAALGDEGWRVIAPGFDGPAHESILAGSLRVERGRVAYVTREGGAVFAVVDGQRGPPFRYVDRLELVGKGLSVLYVGYDDDGARVVVDGVPGPTLDAVHEVAVATLSARWAAIVERGGRLELLRDGVPTTLERGASGLVTSADGARVAWTEPAGRRVDVRVDGARVGRYGEVRELGFVPTSLAPIFVATDERGERVVHAGRAGPRFDAVDGPVVNAAGHWAYVGRRRVGSAVVVDGRPVFRGEWADAPSLATGSARWACVVRQAGRRYVLTPDGRTPIAQPFVDTLVLDPVGAHWAIAVADRETRALSVLVDGAPAADLAMDELATQLGAGADGFEAARAIVASELARAAEEELASEVAPE
ncbi:MAG: hypothetical protein H6719_33605 [Sandaracinaceae bacterium]|nr:hypothetical protein [Sandaracinaceae bacterium]